MSEFHAEVPQATASEGLARGPYVAAGARFEPTTLRMKCDESNLPMSHHAPQDSDDFSDDLSTMQAVEPHFTYPWWSNG